MEEFFEKYRKEIFGFTLGIVFETIMIALATWLLN